MVRAQDPSVMFIAKTWTDKARLERVQRKIQLKHMFESPRRVKASGLALFWKEDFPLDIETFSPNHNDTTINKNQINEWRFTGFYGEPATQKRHESWAKLRQLKNRRVSPWLCAGNFNEITQQSEKKMVEDQGHTIKCNFSEMWLTNALLWTSDLWVSHLLGINTLLTTLFRNG